MRLASYDALLLVSFGGPEGPDDVLPFLRGVTRGRGIPDARLLEVGEHYFRFGGVSPINAQCRALAAALQGELARRELELPVYWGNRNWHPLLADTLAQMRADGVRRAVAVFTSAYASYSSCRQYREDLAAARAAVGEGAPEIDKVRQYFDLPGFVAANVEAVRAAYARLPEPVRPGARLVFTTHSLPVAAADTSGVAGGAYVRQHRQVAALVAAGAGVETGWDLVYQSRSGPPGQPWLEPDVNDHLAALAAAGTPAVVLAPIGFVSDHMEVRFDLDVQAVETAAKLGLPLERAATAGVHPGFVAGLVDLVVERDAEARGVPVSASEAPGVAGGGPAWHATCPGTCCPNPRGPLPTVAGS